MKKTLRVDMVARRSVYVAVDEDDFMDGKIDLEENINKLMNRGNWATHWEVEDFDNGVEFVDEKADYEI